jgi:pimeloyl-ACP methyl ester carboxylesterase
MYEWYPRSSQRALDQVFARCAADPPCRAAYPDPRSDLAATTAALDDAPVELALTDPGTGEPVLVTRASLVAGVHQLLFDTRTAPVLPMLLRAAAEQDWTAVARLVTPLLDAPNNTIPAMALTIGCHEPWASLRRAETEALGVGSYLTYPDLYAMRSMDVCTVVPRPPATALYADPTTVTAPVLAIHGESDPQDPPELMVGIGEHYPDSRLLVARGQAHANWLLPAGCLESIINTFVASASVDAVDATCLEEATAPPFRLP